MSAPCCDVVACGGRCGADALPAAPVVRVAWPLRRRLRRARGQWRPAWRAGEWEPVVPVLTWWSARVMDELPF